MIKKNLSIFLILFFLNCSLLLAGSDTNLMQAARSGNHADLEELIAQKVDINAQNSNGNSALHLAAMKGHNGIVKRLLSAKDISPNLKNAKGNTALHLAVMKNMAGVVIAHADVSADLDMPNATGHTALELAATKGNDQIVVLLIGAGARFTQDANGDTILHRAVNNGKNAIANAIAGSRDVIGLNTQNSDKNTALHLAIIKGHKQIARALIASRTDFDLENLSHYTAYDLAVMNNEDDIADTILSKQLM